MRVASKQLFAQGRTSTAAFTAYTCPTNTRTIIKSVAVYNVAAANRIEGILRSSGGTALGVFIVYAAAFGGAGDYTEIQPWLVMEAGQTIELSSSLQPYYAWLSGAELELP